MLTTQGFEDAGPTPAHAASGSQGRGATATRVLSRGQGLSRGKKLRGQRLAQLTRPGALVVNRNIFWRKNYVARGSRSWRGQGLSPSSETYISNCAAEGSHS